MDPSSPKTHLDRLRLLVDEMDLTPDQRNAIIVGATLAVRASIDTMRDALIERAAKELSVVGVSFTTPTTTK
jgi:hypothetical protein